MRAAGQLLIIISSLAFATGAALAAQQASDVRQIEQKDRDVDTVALDSMKLALKRLSILAQRKRDTAEEPDLLIKMLEALQKISNIQFRLTHGRTNTKEAEFRRNEYNGSLSQTISYVNRLVDRYPSHPFVPKAYIIRGRAHKDLDQKAAAEKDFLFVSERFPNHEMAALATLNLCDLLMEAKDYQRAIIFLKNMESRPNKPYYSIVLQHLAWAHYYLGDIPAALKYSETKVAYHERAGADKSEASEVETAAYDAAMFYSKGIEKKLAGFTVPGALGYFTKVIRGQKFGKVLVKFALHLRANGSDTELEEWEKLLISQMPSMAETLDVYFVALENQVNKRRFDKIREDLSQLPELYSKNPGADRIRVSQKIRGYLTSAATSVQTSLAEAQKRNSKDQPILAQTLKQIYQQILAVSDPKDKSLAKVHFNLAELNFADKDYATAELHYRWVVDNIENDDKLNPGLKARASLSAISSRYETLRAKGLIPKDLKVQAIDPKIRKELSPLLTEWIDWMKVHQRLKSTDNLDVFIFEANRAIYAQGQLEEALIGLRIFVERLPKSSYAIPSASLILDTLIASQRWEKIYEMSGAFYQQPAWKGTEFHKRLYAVGADAYYKMIEDTYKAKDYAKAMEKADDFLKRFSNSARVQDTLIVAANSALGMKDKRRALTYFAPALKKDPSKEVVSAALLTRTSVAEEAFDFETAIRELRSYLKLQLGGPNKPQEVTNLRMKIINIALLLQSLNLSSEILADRTVCTKGTEEACDLLQAMTELTFGSKKVAKETQPWKAMQKAQKGFPGNRAAWAAVALENRREFQLPERQVITEALAASWNNQDPMIKYAVLPKILVSVPSAFQISRGEVRKQAPLKVSKPAIDKRAKLMKHLEENAAKAVGLPWLRVRASILNEIADLYSDFVTDMDKLPVPAGLKGDDLKTYKDTLKEVTAPFVAKTLEFRKQAFDVASQSAVEEETMDSISKAYFKENPAIAETLTKGWSRENPRPINANLMRELDPAGKWEELPAKSDDPGLALRIRLMTSLREKKWTQISFLLAEAKRLQLLQPLPLGVAKSVSLGVAGAGAEALLGLQELVPTLPDESKKRALAYIISHYYNSYSKEKTKQWLTEYFVKDLGKPDSDDYDMIVRSGKWSGADIPIRQLATERGE